MAEYTIRGADYYLNGGTKTIRINPDRPPSIDPESVTDIHFGDLGHQATYESGDWNSGVLFNIVLSFYFNESGIARYLNLDEVISKIYSGRSSQPITFHYKERQVEWRRESETRYTEPTQSTRYDNSIYPSESYTEQGVRGRRIVSWEAEYVNGQPTGNRRNEQTQTLVDMRPTVRVIGTKQDRIEWRTQSHTESITATQTERRDPNVYPEDSYVQQGRDGQKRITYERKYVNGEQTEETRNRRESTIRDMQPYVRVIGTKQRARYLVPRIIFNGKHAIRVVRDNEVVRSIDGLTDLPARQNYVNLSSKSSSGGWARYELTEEISNGLYDLTIETPSKTTVSVEFKVLTFWGDNTTTTVQAATNETVEVNVSSGYYSAGVAVMSIEEQPNNRITNVRLERR
ncbi:G5 domain-containing protein [Dolosigranulum savutiense]|uniref:G5 domain-containing protein n=1 Tax=Dolosigranulum savutiense TaxID=3110288 RepID=A0AB74TVE6_9LACT